jgi:hypothetical protein
MNVNSNEICKIIKLKVNCWSKYNVICPGFRDKKLVGCGSDEAVLLDNSFTITNPVTLT